MTTTLAPSASSLAAATPARRDRYVDFLRVASLVVVMLGHWLMAVVVWDAGRLRAGNVLETSPWARWLTWLFQIMPVFFIVGGFSNAASLAAARRDGVGYGTWLGSRLTRLVRPVLAFAGVWTAAAVGLRLAGVDPATVRAGSIAQPLWFMAVYVAVVAVAPAMVAAHRRWGWAVPVALGAGVAAVDLARWPLGVPLVGWANLALVWLFAHQLGIVWREGGLASWSRARLLVLALAGLLGVVALTELGGYARSMVGGVGEPRSNTFPPSLALVALAVWQLGAVLAARPVVNRWLSRPRVWTAVVSANGMAMTLYLWHLTALVVVSAALLPSGLLPGAVAGSAEWWALRPVWVGLLGVALVPLVLIFAPVEASRPPARRVTGAKAALAAVLVAAGMGFLARRGFVAPGMPAGLPLVPLAMLVGAWRLLGSPLRSR
jgi:hypothetical protein